MSFLLYLWQILLIINNIKKIGLKYDITYKTKELDIPLYIMNKNKQLLTILVFLISIVFCFCQNTLNAYAYQKEDLLKLENYHKCIKCDLEKYHFNSKKN